MIKNVVDYLNYKENVRSHQAAEAENIRSHMADETERNRHNVMTERENYRHNTSTEALGWANYNEDVRSHKANESLKSRELSVKTREVAAKEKDVQSLIGLREKQGATETEKALLTKEQTKTQEAKTGLTWAQQVSEGLVHQYYGLEAGARAIGNIATPIAKAAASAKYGK